MFHGFDYTQSFDHKLPQDAEHILYDTTDPPNFHLIYILAAAVVPSSLTYFTGLHVSVFQTNVSMLESNTKMYF